MPTETCDIGLIGLAVMGQNLVLNMNDHGFKWPSSTEPYRKSTSSSITKPRVRRSSARIPFPNSWPRSKSPDA